MTAHTSAAYWTDRKSVFNYSLGWHLPLMSSVFFESLVLFVHAQLNVTCTTCIYSHLTTKKQLLQEGAALQQATLPRSLSG